jgi:periplasmic mercuric ion binding protein
MKTVKLILLLLIATAGVAFSQSPKTVATVRVKTNVNCKTCETILENYMKREDGIIYCHVDYYTHLATIKYYTDRNNPLYIEYAIANAGFDADTVAANPDSYKRLPPICRPQADSTQKK